MAHHPALRGVNGQEQRRILAQDPDGAVADVLDRFELPHFVGGARQIGDVDQGPRGRQVVGPRRNRQHRIAVTDQEDSARHDAGAADFGDRGIHHAPSLPNQPYARSATGAGETAR